MSVTRTLPNNDYKATRHRDGTDYIHRQRWSPAASGHRAHSPTSAVALLLLLLLLLSSWAGPLLLRLGARQSVAWWYVGATGCQSDWRKASTDVKQSGDRESRVRALIQLPIIVTRRPLDGHYERAAFGSQLLW